MITAIARRAAWTFAVMWFVVTATFAATAAIPIDPARALLGPHAGADDLDRVRAHYCLDRGVAGRYACWLSRAARGDLGESYRSKRAVRDILVDRVWPTAQLALAAVALQLVLGVPLGMIAAIRRGRWPDRAAGFAGVLAQSAPSFFVATLLLYLFAYRWGWFPIAGYGTGLWDRLAHLALPALSLATVSSAAYARVVRGELIEALDEDYVRTARAKGVSERAVVLRHALPAALGPLVALIGIDLGVLLGGAVVVEVVFAWPGLGREVMQAALELDLPLLIGITMVAGVAIALANLVADLVHLWIDPRLRE